MISLIKLLNRKKICSREKSSTENMLERIKKIVIMKMMKIKSTKEMFKITNRLMKKWELRKHQEKRRLEYSSIILREFFTKEISMFF